MPRYTGNLALLILILAPFSSASIYAQSVRTEISTDLCLKKISENVWIHESTIEIPQWGKVSANGLAILGEEELFLVDTPWNERQTAYLVKWFQTNFTVRDVHVIVSHFHQDNMGGLGWIQSRGFSSYGLKKTREICLVKGLPVPETALAESHIFSLGERTIQIFFPGPGHTEDSLAVWLPDEKILFGGCSVKALSNRTVGNTADSDIDRWPVSLKNLKSTFADAVIVVPGHGEEGDLSLIDHTIELISNIKYQ